jgi:hypothetical protein
MGWGSVQLYRDVERERVEAGVGRENPGLIGGKTGDGLMRLQVDNNPQDQVARGIRIKIQENR